jgi:hypothetical protein
MKIRIEIELRITSNPYPLRIVQPYSPLNQPLDFNFPLRQRLLKLTRSKSGGPTLGSFGGVEIRVRRREVFGGGANTCFNR